MFPNCCEKQKKKINKKKYQNFIIVAASRDENTIPNRIKNMISYHDSSSSSI
jgi:hypothetical protein